MKKPSPAQNEQRLNSDVENQNDITKPTTSIKSQRDTIQKHLQQGQSLTTLHAREHYGIMHPAARVMELRKRGFNILLHWVEEADSTGTVHRQGHYVLHQGEYKGAA